MTGFSKEMQGALKADAEKLLAETGEEHTVEFFDFDDDECWQCGGEGYVYNCQDEIGCVDPEGGCDLCMRRCDVCNMKPQLSIDAFADWCEKQPAGKVYDYHDYGACACAQYAATLGISADAWIDVAIDRPTSMWGDANAKAYDEPHTFGALAARLRSLPQ